MVDDKNMSDGSILLIKPDVFASVVSNKSSQRLKMTKSQLKAVVRREIVLNNVWLRDSGLLRPGCYLHSLKYSGVRWNTAKRWQNDHTYVRVISEVKPLVREKRVLIVDEVTDKGAEVLAPKEEKRWLKNLFR